MTKLALTIPEAVAMSGIGRSRLYAIFKAGGIKPRKSGTRTLIIFSDLEAYLQSLPLAKNGGSKT
jgi:Helix-turn-helix domain